MKIVFLCGSLQSGCDGVGDYTRRLACRLIANGLEVFAIALKDRHVSQVIVEVQSDDDVELNVLRIPFSFSQAEVKLIVKKWIDQLQPEWISLQFVPYSFHQKGLPYFLPSFLASLGKFSWHIMFHELWLDSPKGIRQKLVERAQRFIIKALIDKLRPEVTSVSIGHNKIRLEEIGATTNILSLFGNINKKARHTKSDKFAGIDRKTFNILYFGSAPRGEFLELITEKLRHFCQTYSGKVNLIILSRNSSDKEKFINDIKENFNSERLNVISFSFLESDEVSELMEVCTVGIARSEPHLLGKSGSAIAMLEHGLSIWLPKAADKATLDFDFRAELIYTDLNAVIANQVSLHYHSLLPEVAEQFLIQLNSHSTICLS